MPSFPPKNRLPTRLEILRIEVVGKNHTAIYDPNAFTMHSVLGVVTEDEPITSSMLSGEPAYLYRSMDVEIPLSHDELVRLGRLDLTPDEYFRLRDHYGLFHEVHEDFYDPETGDSLQPRRRGGRHA
jgi:hypothetical protein